MYGIITEDFKWDTTCTPALGKNLFLTLLYRLYYLPHLSIVEIFDVDRIHLAQDKVLWPESGNTQTVRFNVSLSTLASPHGKPASVATNHQRTAEVQDKRDILYAQVLQQTDSFVTTLATSAFLKLWAVGFVGTSVMIHQTAPQNKPLCRTSYTWNI
jgi:hypothetical protein